MILTITEFCLGVALALMTLHDVVATAVVSGRTRSVPQVVRRVIAVNLPWWRRARRREQGLAIAFAPSILVQAFLLWMSLLAVAFGLMTHALAGSFDPVLPSFPQALFVAGSGLATVGLSETDATGAARWVVMAAGFCGLAVMTLTITYLLMVQGGVAGRDSGILKLTTSAGAPPSGVALLERYASLDMIGRLPELLHDARDWCAEVRQSHASHPSLIYFRSVGAASGWPAALGALMDLALVCVFLLDDRAARGPAVLLEEEGGRMARTLVDLVGLNALAAPPAEGEVHDLLGRLAGAGLSLRAEPDLAGFVAARARHAGCIRALAEHLGSLEAPLTPPPRGNGPDDAVFS